MDVKDVPQDDSRIYRGQRKILYATRQGRYESAASSGWQDETYATEQAVADWAAWAQQAYAEAAAGKRSPLYYHMFRYRHDEVSLAQSAGVWRWQLRRHLHPDVFAKLSDRCLQKYARALNMPVNALRTLPSAAELSPFGEPL